MAQSLNTFAYVLVSTLAFVGPVAAEPQAVDLRTSIRLAVKGNVSLQRERVRLPAAQSNLLSAYGKFDIDLALNAEVAQRRTPPIVDGALNGGQRTTQSLELSLSRELETGGRATLSTDIGRTRSSIAFDCGQADRFTCTFFGTRWQLQLAHPLWRGLGQELATSDIRRRRLEQDVALLQRHVQAAVLLRDIVHHHWDLAFATRDLALRVDALGLARDQLRITRALVMNGRVAKSELVSVELAIANRQREVAVAEQSLALGGLILQRDFGHAPRGDVSLTVADAPNAQPYPVDARAATSHALRFSPSLRRLDRGLELRDIDIEVARATMRPRLDVIAAVGSSGRKDTLDKSLDQMTRLQQSMWSIQLNFQLPLQNRTAKGSHASTLWQREAKEIERRDLELELRHTVATLAIAMHTAAKSIEHAQAAIGFAARNLEAEQARFAAGRSTNNDVLLRQQELKAAELEVARANVDWLKNEASLDALTGGLLTRLGLELEEL